MVRFQGFDPGALYTVQEAAEGLGFSPITLNKWRSEGGGPSYLKLRGRIFYRGDALNGWQATAETGGTPAPEPTAPEPAEAA